MTISIQSVAVLRYFSALVRTVVRGLKQPIEIQGIPAKARLEVLVLSNRDGKFYKQPAPVNGKVVVTLGDANHKFGSYTIIVNDLQKGGSSAYLEVFRIGI